ncbi:MAG: DUF3987 domain-containing protein [Blastochloris viridis]|uniref:DUF3987 domain-containing protein n=1 Tax=Blastochloris viridis TaxID=1079 RepID=A0A6N4RD82_BLAVI|nr:MAG: DUF3987 domain-containing protein [Blastochloris viridis]
MDSTNAHIAQTPDEQQSHEQRIEAAVESYFAAGFKCFPLREREKTPATPHGFKNAASSMEEYRALVGNRLNLNTAIATGEASGMWVLDIDGPEGEAILAALEAEHGPLTPAAWQTTGKGRHLLFRYSTGKIANRAGVRPGLDVRGDGGYIVAAPSIHPNGHAYEMYGDITALLPAPDWLVELVTAPKVTNQTEPALPLSKLKEWSATDIVNMLASLDPSLGYDEWLHVGMSLHAGGWPLAFWEEWSRPGSNYQKGECAKHWKSFSEKPGGITMGTLVRMAQQTGWGRQIDMTPIAGHPAEALLRSLENVGIVATPATLATLQPIPLRPDQETETPFPVEALGVLAPAAKAIADVVQAPLAMCGQSVLAAATLAVQGYADLQMPHGQVRPISNFYLTLAVSGDRKTACDNLALKAVRAFEENAYAAYRIEEKRHQAELKAHKAGLVTGGRKKGVDLEAILTNPEPEAPLSPMRICQEPTFEGLCRLLRQGTPSMGIFSDEGGQFLGGYGMADENRVRTIANLSAFWDGSPITRVRKEEGSHILYGKRVSMHLMLQPLVAAMLLDNELIRAQGVLGRCLLACPTSLAGTRMYRAADPSSLLALEEYHALITKLMEAPFVMKEGQRNELEPRPLQVPKDLVPVWVAFHDEVESQVGLDGNYEVVSTLACKMAEHALRIAGVLTLVHDINAIQVTEEALQGGVNLARYYLQEALRFNRQGTLNVLVLQAEKLWKWIDAHWEEKTITLRDVCRGAVPHNIRPRVKALAVLQVLEDHHYLEPVEKDPRTGKRKGEKWYINRP